jgi:hypothetical protein
MAVLEEEAGQFLVPHVPAILNVYAQALMHYKTKVPIPNPEVSCPNVKP